jgi:hypothetical protein
MTTHVFNEAKRAIMAGEIDLNADDIRASWHMTNTTCSTEQDTITTNTNFTTPDEFDGANYSTPGFALTTEAVNRDDGNDRAEFDADDIAAGTQAASGTGRTVDGILIYKFVTNWGASTPICYLDAPFTPNGGTITITWDGEGILQGG